jgi:hypothetical protein
MLTAYTVEIDQRTPIGNYRNAEKRRISPPAALEARRHGEKRRRRLTTEGAEDAEVRKRRD